MWRCVVLAVLGGLAVAASSPDSARAGDMEPSSMDWTVKGGLYGWFPWVQGSATARDETFNLYATPIDLIENFDAPPIMVNFEARKGKFSFWGDALYADFAFNDEFVSEREPIPALKLSGSGSSQTDFNLGVYQLGAFYEVADFAGANGNKTTVELGAGARYIHENLKIKAKIDASAQVRLGKLADQIEKRIRRIQNQEQRLESLAALNELRQGVLEERIIRAEDKRHERRVKRLENRLKRVDDRGEAIAALEAVEALRLELLRAALRVNGNEFNDQFAFVDGGSLDWVDPTIAVRFQHHFGSGHSITATGDFGGFNIDDSLSSQMQLTYNIDGTLWGFQTTTTVGYRALWINYEEQTSNGESGINIWLHGPLAEVLLRW